MSFSWSLGAWELSFPLIEPPSLTFWFWSGSATSLTFSHLLISRRRRECRLALAQHLRSPFEASGEGSPTSGPRLQRNGSHACHSVKLKLREEPFSLMAQDLKETSQDLVIACVVLDALQKTEDSVEMALTNLCSWLCKVLVISYNVVLPFCKKKSHFPWHAFALLSSMQSEVGPLKTMQSSFISEWVKKFNKPLRENLLH